MSATMTNGAARPRKSLASQLDRLDLILDGLADGLNEAVAAAVQKAVMLAVREAVAEVLSNPEVLAALRAPVAAEPRPSRWARLKTRIAGVSRTVVHGLSTAATTVVGAVVRAGRGVADPVIGVAQAVGRSVCSAWSRLRWLLGVMARLRAVLLTASLVGVAAAVLALVGGRWIAAAESGVGGFLSALAVQAGFWMRRLVREGPARLR